jgi:phosphopantothenoylcysteine decarboxylase / phosphopantothenate---cysteine ligase
MKINNIILGVTGGIAAYKTPSLVRLLKKQGFNVKVILSENGKQFVTPLSLETVSQNQVYTGLFDKNSNNMEHISLSAWGDLVLIAPATANIISKQNWGVCDDLLSTFLLATKAKVFIAPGMNTNMWEKEITQQNVRSLKNRGVSFIGPDNGELACGDTGYGRMSSPENIVDSILEFSNNSNLLKGKKVLITGGATREYIDPCRFISNPSTGKMGINLAKTAFNLGADVTLILGNSSILVPEKIKIIRINSAEELANEVFKNYENNDLVIMSAAVSDWTPSIKSDVKIKKEKKTELNIKLVRTVDILKSLGEKRGKNKKPVLIGFAAETASHDKLKELALKKLSDKKCDFIIANDVSNSETGFESENNEVMILGKNGFDEKISFNSKLEISKSIFKMLNSKI